MRHHRTNLKSREINVLKDTRLMLMSPVAWSRVTKFIYFVYPSASEARDVVLIDAHLTRPICAVHRKRAQGQLEFRQIAIALLCKGVPRARISVSCQFGSSPPVLSARQSDVHEVNILWGASLPWLVFYILQDIPYERFI